MPWQPCRGIEALFAEVGRAAGADRRLDAQWTSCGPRWATRPPPDRARRVAERMALVLQGSLLVRYGHPAVADAFCATRLGGDWGVAFGTLPTGAGSRGRSSSVPMVKGPDDSCDSGPLTSTT